MTNNETTKSFVNSTVVYSTYKAEVPGKKNERVKERKIKDTRVLILSFFFPIGAETLLPKVFVSLILEIGREW